ncbi:MAG: hypothetical protein IRY89_15485 [Pseudolabrys sp.]|nr:hypothetical protein [Pseudolabrys sp.]
MSEETRGRSVLPTGDCSGLPQIAARKMTQRWTIALGLICAALASKQTFAADDEALVRILARVDIAHNFVFYCAQFDPSIIDKTKSAVGDIQALMVHIRDEVVSDLPKSEAARIVIRSADTARIGALRTVRRFYGPNRQEERARLTDWCESAVVPSIKEFIAQHDNDHAAFEYAIRRAKWAPNNGAAHSP